MRSTPLSSWILNRFLTERRWFIVSSPRLRPVLRGVEAALMGAACAGAIAGVYRWHAGRHGIDTISLLVAVIGVICLAWAPLARFLVVERSRDQACDQYVEYARQDSVRPADWPRLAIRHALTNRDRATAVALCARLLGADLQAARRTVAGIERELAIEDEEAAAHVPTFC